jgi:hypothetical protein
MTFAAATLAAPLATAACQSGSASDIQVPGGLAGARPVSYDTIRQASGVLGYAEALLGPELATRYQVPVGPGASVVEPAVVAGAWELPAGTRTDEVAASLRATGTLDRARDRENGQLWIADWNASGKAPVRLLLIDGTNPAWESRAVPEVRPGPHIYLIAYRRP